MAKSERPLNFDSAEHRDKWFADNADYYTAVHARERGGRRAEFFKLKQAISVAKVAREMDPTATFLIYAVVGNESAYVTTVSAEKPNG